ncbi:MAG: tetratricopeptide repeat protein [Candidatus Edwardsbacteria bacterium]|nr:tetratricopeptide repeat protein [Candidatus Edwardsbacteria bacterium]
MSHNISKHRLKHDEFAEDMAKTINLFRKYSTEILAVLVGALIIVIGLFFVAQNRTKNEREANLLLGSAHAALFSGDAQQSRQGYEDIIKRFGSTESAKEAMVNLGNLNFQMRNQEEALKYYQRAVQAKPKSYLLMSAAIGGVAACYEQSGDFNKAAEEYMQIFQRYPKQNYVSLNAMLSAGRCYRAAGNNIKARETYQSIVSKYPDDQNAQKARSALAMLPPAE